MRALHFFWIWFVVSTLCAWVVLVYANKEDGENE